MSNSFRPKIDALFVHNEGVLSSAFDLKVRKLLIHKRSGLDLVSLRDPVTQGAFAQANNLQAIDVASHCVNILTNTFGVWTQIKLWCALSRSSRLTTNASMRIFALAATAVQYFRWFYMPSINERSRATLPAFQRLNELWALSCQAEEPHSSAELKLLNLGDYICRQYDLAQQGLGNTAFIRSRARPHLHFALDVFSHAWPVAMRCAFALQALRSPQSAGSIAQLSVTILCARKISNTLSNLISAIDDVRVDCARIRAFYQVMEVRATTNEPEEPLAYEAMHGPLGQGMRLEFRDVCFGYNGANGPLALRNLSFILPAGGLVCVVGGNGAGKSTLIKLLSQLHQPTSGQIFVNGKNALLYSSDTLRSVMAVQLQTCPISHLTIAEYIALGSAAQHPQKEVDTEAVEHALRTANALHIVERLDKGIHSRLGPFPPRATPRQILADALLTDENAEDEWSTSESLGAAQPANIATTSDKRDTTYSCTFSGGEWARLHFARTLMRKADFRIFDEPAAALDPVAAETVFSNIDSLRGHQTIVHITHNIRSTMSADLILCLNNGEIVEQGSHGDLMRVEGGFYRKLALAQMPDLLAEGRTPLSTPSEIGSVGSEDSGFFSISKD